MHALLLASLLAAAPGPKPPAAPPNPDDGPTPDELDLLKMSVLPDQQRALEAQVHGLGHLPLYRVQVDIEPDGNAFEGREQIRYPTAEPLGVLYLRVYNNAPFVSRGKEPLVELPSVTCPGQPCTAAVQGDPTLWKVSFEPPLPPGAVAHVDVQFRGHVPVLSDKALAPGAQMGAQLSMLGSGGTAPSDHGAFSSGLGVLALTGLFPQVAARIPGGFDVDVPSGIGDVASYDLSNYLFSATVPQGTRVVAGGVELGNAPQPSGKQQFSFAGAALRDFPVYASAQWKESSATAGAVKVRGYFLPGDELNGKKALDTAARALKEFAGRFGPYPWTEFKVVEQGLNDGAGGIEYPTVIGLATLVFRTDQGMGPMGALFRPQAQLGSTTANLSLSDKLLEFTVAHEVAHQWWSILVGSDPHRHPEVDEPLTQYSAALYLESRRGRGAYEEALTSQVATTYQLMRASGGTDAAAGRPVGAFDGELQYAGLIYGKAPLFYRAARKQLGDAAFGQVLARYARKFRFAEAGPGGVVEACREVAPRSAPALEKLRVRWFDEVHGDDDLGELDLGAMIEASTGMRMSREEKAMFQSMLPMLMELVKGGGAGGLGGSMGGAQPGLPPGMSGMMQGLPPNLGQLMQGLNGLAPDDYDPDQDENAHRPDAGR
jgi:hypothetical protein